MKKFLAIILCLCLGVCLCGCNTDTDNASSDNIVTEYEQVIVDDTGSGTSTDNSQATNNNTNVGNVSNDVNNGNVNNNINSNTIVNNNSSSTNNGANSNSTVSNSSVNNNTSTNNNGNANNNSSADNTTSSNPFAIDYDTIVEVDICDDIVRGYLDSTETHRQYYWLSNYSGTRYDNQCLVLDFNMTGGPYTVYFSEKSDFSNATTVQTMSTTVKSSILVPGKTYYWKVVGAFSPYAIGGGRIKVKDAPVRWIQIDGSGNVRDMGGWKTASGKTVKYGMMYRGQNIDNVTVLGLETIKQLGLKTELDLRYESQKNQKEGTGMKYVFLETSAQYDRIFSESYKPEMQKNYREIFSLLSNESNYPFYTHCSAGADRTGAFAFLTNGLLGVSYEDLTRDFELTSFSSSGKRWRGKGSGSTFLENDYVMQEDGGNYVAWGKLYNGMMDYGKQNGCTTLEASIEHYLINYIGVPKTQIDSFKKIMLK